LTQFQYLNIERFPNEQVIELLEENVIGTPGKSMLYKHHNVKEKLKDVPDPYYANLSIRNRLYGTICLSKRNVYSLGKLHQAYYLRYFTFRESLRSSGTTSHSEKPQSKLREEVNMLMNGKGLNVHGDLLLYAYIDSQNKRSKRLIDEFGFHIVGQFNVITFSRLFPVNSKQLEISVESDQDMIFSSLTSFYKNSQLVTFENLFRRGAYFFIKENGVMICGVQVVADQWDIMEMPGLGGRLLMNFIPNIPVLNRLFSTAYKFVLLEMVFCQEGYEKNLSELFESVLNHFKVYTGILCIDPRSKAYRMVKSINLGITHKLQGEKQIDIVAKTSKQDLVNPLQPIAVSGFDVL